MSEMHHGGVFTFKDAARYLQEARENGLQGPLAVRIDVSPSIVGIDTDNEGKIFFITDFNSPRTQPSRPEPNEKDITALIN